MIIIVTAGANSSVKENRQLAALVTRYAVKRLASMRYIVADTVLLVKISFGAMKLISDIELPMPH
ncbi:hypothetical protein [Agrobacterium tumefaciens]|uniref:hypothetical protein n=1 Tax=Agrobacterium tumefaciens TaxID=358 RepID=UPI0015741A5B|nr:hypothetical protein [Agrobacterium tumefaciens]NSZ66555.1 hypothetical protein [Agrobacterium tumefaciens]NTA19445.1 hypothetical protein [Agrobacterium tumefaciens]NTA72927.1 hypothetical protein [Agrobacterium tumefaciens]WCK74344.1 hypothetical protein G6L96_026125 [Agrobacterium tumefaciens]WIE41475.1 hypothetical protein G6L16_026680 [Agrobacterium tumefaciens]